MYAYQSIRIIKNNVLLKVGNYHPGPERGLYL